MGIGNDPVSWLARLLDGRGPLLVMLAFVALGALAVLVGPLVWRFVVGSPEVAGSGAVGAAVAAEAARRRIRATVKANRVRRAQEAAADADAQAAVERVETEAPETDAETAEAINQMMGR